MGCHTAKPIRAIRPSEKERLPYSKQRASLLINKHAPCGNQGGVFNELESKPSPE